MNILSHHYLELPLTVEALTWGARGGVGNEAETLRATTASQVGEERVAVVDGVKQRLASGESGFGCEGGWDEGGSGGWCGEDDGFETLMMKSD